MKANRLFMFVALLCGSLFSFGQQQTSATDFWQAFETCTSLPNLTPHYGPLVPGVSMTHHIMDQGLNIPDATGVALTTGNNFNVADKNTLTSGNYSNFFIMQDYTVTTNTAIFDFAYYYNFSGNYAHYVNAHVELAKQNNQWVVVQSDIQ